MRYTAWFYEREKAQVTSIESSAASSSVSGPAEDASLPRWVPFSKNDSARIERAYLSDELDDPILVQGSFYIVNLAARILTDAYYGNSI